MQDKRDINRVQIAQLQLVNHFSTKKKKLVNYLNILCSIIEGLDNVCECLTARLITAYYIMLILYS